MAHSPLYLYFVRVTDDAKSAVVEHLLTQEAHTKWAYCQEVGANGRTHCHLLFDSETKMQSLRLHIKKFYPERDPSHSKGNSLYSLTQCKDELKCFAYILKERNQEDYVGDYSEYYQTMFEDAINYDAKVKAEVKNPGSGVVKQIMQKLSEVPKESITPVMIYEYVSSHYAAQDKLIRKGMLDAVALTVLSKALPETYKELTFRWACDLFAPRRF